jgi:uncharacterized protein (DUF488 family)
MKLFTIGHSNRSYAELVEALRAHGVETLVDIRHFPRSRANPQFNADVLANRLPRDGIAFVEERELGGRRGTSKTARPGRNAGWQVRAFKNYADYAETREFQRAFRRLLSRARKQTCAIMCAEVLWWRCHRRIVADYALARGVDVFHIFSPTKLERAKRTPFARLDSKTKTLRYPAPRATSTRESTARARIRAPAGRTRSASRPPGAKRAGRPAPTSRSGPRAST